MKRILLRSGKDPFEIASPEATLESNLIADNSGNLVFMQARSAAFRPGRPMAATQSTPVELRLAADGVQG
jgi:hypothetical protein